MLKQIYRNKVLIVSILLVLVLCSLGILKENIDLSLFLEEDKSIHFDLLTVNSIIAGFMFSGLSLIVGMSNSKTVEELEKSNHMDKIYTNIIVGIFFNVISIIIALLVLLQISSSIVELLVSIEIIFLIIGILCFGLSVIDLRFLIHSIRGEVKKIDKDTIKSINEAIIDSNRSLE